MGCSCRPKPSTRSWAHIPVVSLVSARTWGNDVPWRVARPSPGGDGLEQVVALARQESRRTANHGRRIVARMMLNSDLLAFARSRCRENFGNRLKESCPLLSPPASRADSLLSAKRACSALRPLRPILASAPVLESGRQVGCGYRPSWAKAGLRRLSNRCPLCAR